LRVLQRIARAVEADDEAVADQHVVADAFDNDEVLHTAGGKDRRREGNREGGQGGEETLI